MFGSRALKTRGVAMRAHGCVADRIANEVGLSAAHGRDYRKRTKDQARSSANVLFCFGSTFSVKLPRR